MALAQPACVRELTGELAALSSRLLRFAEGMPPLLRDATFDYVDALGLGRERMAWPTIYFLWPYWVQHDLGRPVDDGCREIAHANACLTYAVLVQDRAMDEDRRGSGRDLMAANELLTEALLAYGSLFPAPSPFWPRCRALMRESWEGLLAEKVTHAAPDPAMLDADDAIQRSKVNWLKVAAVAVGLRAGREGAIAQLLDHLDHWQSGCQLVDDFEDHRGDLASGNYTRFLVEAGVAGPGGRARASVERFLGGGALPAYFDRARDEYRLALRACPLPAGHLQDHVASLLADLAALRAPYDALLDVAGRCT
jgi:hypothetical protein